MKVWVLLLAAAAASGQAVKKTPRKAPAKNVPVCVRGAICFSGRVEAEQEFRRQINAELEFVLSPGWAIEVWPVKREEDCHDFANVLNPPYRAHRSLYIDMSYGWTAMEEVSFSPREFRFVTNCVDYRIEGDRLNVVMWPYNYTEKEYDAAVSKLGTSPHGEGRLWITDFKVSEGKIDWMKFTVELKLPPIRK